MRASYLPAVRVFSVGKGLGAVASRVQTSGDPGGPFPRETSPPRRSASPAPSPLLLGSRALPWSETRPCWWLSPVSLLKRHFSASGHSGGKAGLALHLEGEFCGCRSLGQRSSWGLSGRPTHCSGGFCSSPVGSPLCWCILPSARLPGTSDEP